MSTGEYKKQHHGGQADDYYDGGSAEGPPAGEEYGTERSPAQYGHYVQPAPGHNGHQAPPAPQTQQYGDYSQPPPQQPQYQNEAQYPIAPPIYSAPPPTQPQKPNASFEEQFKIAKPKYNDWWAGILFILTVAAYFAVGGLAVSAYAKYGSGGIYGGKNDFGLDSNTLILFAFVLGVAFVLSIVYLLMARMFTKTFIWLTIIANIAIGLGTAAYYFYRKYYSSAIVFLIFSVFYIVCAWSWRKRVPFAVVMLQTAIDVARKTGHVFIASFIGGLLALLFSAWFSVTLVAAYIKYTPDTSNGGCSAAGGTCSYGALIGILVFFTFAGYWVSEFIKDAIHVTISGVYGSWYFFGGTGGAGVPSNATRAAFRRAMTYSFGSISLGSLIVAFINVLRQIAQIGFAQNQSEGDFVGMCLWCIARMVLAILDWAVQYINKYAFSHIALYGKGYLPAAKDTWKMMRDRGFDALINDCILDPVLTVGSVLIGYLAALLAFLYLEFTDPPYNTDGSFTPVIMAFAFLIGLQICNVFMTPIKSGVATIFVAMAWDPDVAQRQHPEFWAQVVRVYPRVQEAIHSV